MLFSIKFPIVIFIVTGWKEQRLLYWLTNELESAYLLGTVIENNRFDTTIAGKYPNSLTFKIHNANNTKSLYIQSSSFNNNLCYNELADHNIEISFTNLAVTSFMNKFKIRDNVFYGAQTSAIKGDSLFAYVWLESNECKNSYMGSVNVTETTGQLGIVGLDQHGSDIRFKSTIRLSTNAPAAYGNGQMWYDTSTHAVKLVINGVVKTINVT